MRRLWLALVASLAFAGAAQAQVPCVGVGGVNNVANPSLQCAQEPTVATFAAVAYDIQTASGVTDFGCITGATGIVVRIQRVRVFGHSTSATSSMSLMYRTVADTGGTAATGTGLGAPYAVDGGSATLAKATTVFYTANPTINDATNRPIAGGVFTSTTTSPQGLLFDYTGQRYSEAPTLRGPAQQLCINLDAATYGSASIGAEIDWTETVQ